MNKTIRIFAIIATALAGFSLMLLIVSLPLQRVLAHEIFGYPDDILSVLPQFPLVPFLLCSLQAGCIALLIICCGNKKGGIWLEILIIIALAIILPLTNTVASMLYSAFVVNFFGSTKMIANSVVSQISSYCCYPAGCGQILAYIACGMSIAFKTMSKKQNMEH